MIHKIKTYEIRSHDFHTNLSITGQLLSAPTLFTDNAHFTKSYIRRVLLHFQEVLKCIRSIEKTLAVKKALAKEPMLDSSSTAFSRCSQTFNQEAEK